MCYILKCSIVIYADDSTLYFSNTFTQQPAIEANIDLAKVGVRA